MLKVKSQSQWSMFTIFSAIFVAFVNLLLWSFRQRPSNFQSGTQNPLPQEQTHWLKNKLESEFFPSKWIMLVLFMQ